MNDNLKLSLGGGNSTGGGDNGAPKPVAGWFAVGFGLLSIFGPGHVFVPLTLVSSIIALLMGQFIWAATGLMLAIAGFLTSPLLWAALGLGWLIHLLNSIGIPLPPGVAV